MDHFGFEKNVDAYTFLKASVVGGGTGRWIIKSVYIVHV